MYINQSFTFLFWKFSVGKFICNYIFVEEFYLTHEIMYD